MESWALVIGIDRYELPQASLKGAVRDAVEMRKWLVDPAGGAVPEQNVTLLLSPREGAEPPPAEAKEATQGNILESIANLIQRSGGEGERLYFFYAGHGVSTFVEASEENALVAADFTGIKTQNSVALRTLWEYFETWQFQDQFFFVDACRNIPVDFDFRVGEWTQPRRRNPGLPPVQQFILYATSPGLRAAEAGAPGDERGHFTDALLAGLKGAGAAKAWSRANDRYEVRWNRLVRYVTRDVQARKVEVGGPEAENIFQIPQETPKRGVVGRDADPVLAHFPAKSFDAEKLAINLRPEDVYAVAEIIVSREWGEPLTREANIPRLPVEFELEPNVYLIRGTAPAYQEAYYGDPLEVYSPCTIEVDFKPLAADEPAAAAVGGDGDEAAAARAAPEAQTSGTLVVKSSDPLALLEVTDSAGQALETGAGTVTLEDLPAGVYRSTLRTPDNEVVEQLVEIAPGEEREIELTAPAPRQTRALSTFLAASGGSVREDNTVVVQEGVQPVSAPRPSTVLGIAGAASIRDDAHARELGFRAAGDVFGPETESGVYVLLGIDWDDAARTREYMANVGLRLWELGRPIPQEVQHVRPLADMTWAGELAQDVGTGAYWLALEPPDATAIVVALTVFPKRVTMLTVHLGGRRPRIFQYAPSVADDRSCEPDAVRRLEVMERLIVGGQLGAAHDVARPVLESPSIVDPLATTLAGYIALRAGRIGDVGEVLQRLVDEYGGLSDAQLLLGERLAAVEHPGTADAFRRAVDAGAPVFAEGLTRLLEGLRAFEIEHPKSKLVQQIFDHHLTGSMWSAWRPETFRPGELLIP